jgi:DNA topoisomerase-1
MERPADTGVVCPKCQRGTLLKKQSRKGKVFYSCSTYPKCDYAVWNEPIAGPCPQCGWPILTVKVSKRGPAQKVCPQKDCSYSAPYEQTAEHEEAVS